MPAARLWGLLTVTPEVFEEVAEVRISPEVHERLVAWRARFGLAIDNALNFLNNPDGIQGHSFATQIAHIEDRRVLQGRLTLVRYNNEPQFFVADASVFLGLVSDVLERLGPYLEPDAVDPETIARLKEADRARRAQDDAARMSRRGSRPAPRRRPRSRPGQAGMSLSAARRNRRLAFVLLAVFALIALAILASPFATAPTHP